MRWIDNTAARSLLKYMSRSNRSSSHVFGIAFMNNLHFNSIILTGSAAFLFVITALSNDILSLIRLNTGESKSRLSTSSLRGCYV